MASFAATSSTSLSRQMAIAVKPVNCFSQGRSNLSFKLRPLLTKRFSVSCAAKPETVDKVCAVVKEQLSLEEDQKVTGASAFADLGADSLDTVEVVMALEEAFGIEMPEEKAQYATTIEKAAEIIEEVLASKA